MLTAHASGVDGRTVPCRCGGDRGQATQRLGCQECGAACCTACVITLESVAYCRDCATTLLGTTARPSGGRFELY